MSYTKGPWWLIDKKSELDDCQEFFLRCGEGYLGSIDSSRNENLANAILISAAPELLEALEAFAKIEIDCATEIVPNGYADPQMWREHVISARAIIAKAKGEVK